MTARPHLLAVADTQRYLSTLRERLPLFTVTDHPRDYPDYYVARLHLTLPGVEVLPFAIMDRDLETLRATLRALGLTLIPRDPTDDPVILESWI